MNHDLDEVRRVMAEAVREASRVCRRIQATLRPEDATTKGDRSPVTVADLAAQAVVARRLSDAFPGVPLTAEEDAAMLRSAEGADLRATVLANVATERPDLSADAALDALDRGGHTGGATGRYFTLDPIDGTKGFLRKEQYAVALALIEDGRVVAGVLGCPNLPAPDGRTGTVLHAVRGRGTFAAALDAAPGDAGAPTRVSLRAHRTELRLCESVETGHSDRGASSDLRERLGTRAEPVRMDSQAKYALIALGRAELYFRAPTQAGRSELIWDHAAGVIVVEEAGGRVTDLAGAPIDFSCGRKLERNRGVVATNGLVHAAVLAAL